MSNFALLPVPQIKGTIQYRKLEIDGVCPFDSFCNEIQMTGNLRKQLPGLFQIMDDVANRKSLPREKFKDITPAKEKVREYEFKKKDLRAYAIKDNGHILIFGGRKSTQQNDIRQFRSIKKRYLETKIQSSHDKQRRTPQKP